MRLIALMGLWLLALPIKADAADPTGVWKFDDEGFRSSMIEMLQPLLAEMPEDMRPQMEQMMLQQFDSRGPNVSSTATFHADGTVVHENEAGERDTATWRSVGSDMIEITIPDGGEVIQAVIDGDRMVADFSDAESGMSMQMVWNRQ